MTKVKELLDKIEKITEPLKEYDKFKYLFSEDEGEKILSGLLSNVKRLRFLVNAIKIKEIEFPDNKAIQEYKFGGKSGTLVSVRPCAEIYEGKTFVGFLIGEVSMSSELSIEDDKFQLNYSQFNPAILIPEIGKIVYGYESWWGKIKSIEELKEITDEDINNVWYVDLLRKQLSEKVGEKK